MDRIPKAAEREAWCCLPVGPRPADIVATWQSVAIRDPEFEPLAVLGDRADPFFREVVVRSILQALGVAFLHIKVQPRVSLEHKASGSPVEPRDVVVFPRHSLRRLRTETREFKGRCVRDPDKAPAGLVVAQRLIGLVVVLPIACPVVRFAAPDRVAWRIRQRLAVGEQAARQGLASRQDGGRHGGREGYRFVSHWCLARSSPAPRSRP